VAKIGRIDEKRLRCMENYLFICIVIRHLHRASTEVRRFLGRPMILFFGSPLQRPSEEKCWCSSAHSSDLQFIHTGRAPTTARDSRPRRAGPAEPHSPHPTLRPFLTAKHLPHFVSFRQRSNESTRDEGGAACGDSGQAHGKA